ncbi:MAG: hypothetical protein Q3997_07850 [Propionibacteriaceae bacterium]|nr:hypothetical protein [Propionibacteriaceae bacterium]
MSLVCVPKNYLMLTAGLVWTAAGTLVARTGLPLLLATGDLLWLLSLLSVAVFLTFYLLIFSRLVKRHTARVRDFPEDRRPVWQFFDARSYLVMAVMMGGGMALRLSHALPDWTIGFFYTGLGIALGACGIRFLSVFAHNRVLTPSAMAQPRP